MDIKTENQIIEDFRRIHSQNANHDSIGQDCIELYSNHNTKWVNVDDVRKELIRIENIIFDDVHDNEIIKLINNLSQSKKGE